MLQLTKDKKFYQTFLSMMVVIALQNLISYSVNMADNLMLGSYSQSSLSGAAVVNQIQFFWQQVTVGLGDGIIVLCSQYWGKKQIKPIKELLGIALIIGFCMGMFLFFITACFPEGVVRLFTNDEETILEAIHYLHIIKYTYVIFGITNLLLAVFRSVEIVKIAFFISVSTLLINVGINYTLIFGNFGMPQLGVVGAAIGTLVARIIELCIILFYIIFIDKRLCIKIKELCHPSKQLVHDFFKVSVPVVVTQALWGLSVPVQTAILGHLSADAIAANSVASTLFQYLKVFASSAAAAASILIGKTIGTGKTKYIKEYVNTLQCIFIAIGLFISAAILLIKNPLLSLYTLTDHAASMAASMLSVLGIICIGTAYQMPTAAGIIRGGGDTKFTLIMDTISIWCMVIPISFLAAYYWHLSPVIVVAILNSDQIFKCIPVAIRANRYKWITHLTTK